MKLVQLRRAENKGPVWVNPFHVIAVYPREDGGTDITTIDGEYLKITEEPWKVVHSLQAKD